jgi:hypothetical protein
MTTCFLKYIIDPAKVGEFEHYGKLWIDLVNEMGGLHHGYLLPHEGANNVGYASFSFHSLAAYETYRNEIQNSPKCLEAFQFAIDTKCILSYERNFLKPVFEGFSEKAKLFY